MISFKLSRGASSGLKSTFESLRNQFDAEHIVVTDGYLHPNGYQQVFVNSLTFLTVPTGPRLAIIQVESGSVRYRDDGVNPTLTVGMPLATSATLFYMVTLA